MVGAFGEPRKLRVTPTYTIRSLKLQRDKCLVWGAHRWREMRAYHIDSGLLIATLLRVFVHRAAAKQKLPNHERQKILAIRLDGMGDLIMTTPIFQELKLKYPTAELIAVVQERNKDLLENNPYVDRILYPAEIHKSTVFKGIRRGLSIAALYRRSLRSEAISITIQPRLGKDYYGANLLMKLVDAPIGFRYSDKSQKGIAKALSCRAFRSVTNVTRSGTKHEVLSNLAIVERLAGKSSGCRPQIFPTEEDGAFARAAVTDAGRGSVIVGVAFGAQSKRRKWPLDRWSEVIHMLSQYHDICVVLVCSNAEKDDGEVLRALLKVKTALICGVRLRRAAACIETCDLFVGTDTGLAHMAAAVDCPTVVVSPHPIDGDADHDNSPIRFRPWSENGRVIQPKSGTYPCGNGCEAVEAHCILQVTPEQVAQSCIEMLGLSRKLLRKPVGE
jgi:ADP-heptose:LPS heptosyltransferase